MTSGEQKKRLDVVCCLLTQDTSIFLRHSQKKRQILLSFYKMFRLVKDRYAWLFETGTHSQQNEIVSSPGPSPLTCRKRALELASCVLKAGDGTRTRDSLLGKQGFPISPLA
jgi:hypothetical protein